MSIKKGWGKREKATDYGSSSVSKGRKKDLSLFPKLNLGD
jgi:hypothetical protein